MNLIFKLKPMITMNVQEPYRTMVIDGRKTVEGRLKKGKFAALKIGDILELEPDKIRFEVIGKNIYASFREMIEKEGIENVVPDKKTVDEAVSVYYHFFTPEQEKEYGVVAFRIEKS